MLTIALNATQLSSDSTPGARMMLIRERQRNGLEILDLVENPSAGKRPVVLYRGHRNTQGLGCFLVRHSYEITQFDYH